jgi:hypothetical protein
VKDMFPLLFYPGGIKHWLMPFAERLFFIKLRNYDII